jgi:putative nucleotidyltransferase-like protein
MIANDTATAALLWSACGLTPDTAEVQRALAEGADLEGAATVATHQRVSPMLCRGLRAAGVDIDGDACAALRADVARCRAQATMLLPTAVRLALQPLLDRGFEPLAIKGAALAERYPSAGTRPMDDIDVLVMPNAYRDALDTMLANGWREAARADGVQHHDTVLVHADVPGLPVELHWTLATWRQRSTSLSGERLWRERRPQVVFGVAAFGLAPEIELVAVATHAAKPFHQFNRLLWSVDAAVIIDAAGAAFDWDRVESIANSAGARTPLSVLLQQARRLGAPVPELLCEPPARGARRAALALVLSPEWPLIRRDSGSQQRLRHALVDQRRWHAPLFVSSVVGAGPAAAAGRSLQTGLRAVRRWWRLRRGLHDQGTHRSPAPPAESSPAARGAATRPPESAD